MLTRRGSGYATRPGQLPSPRIVRISTNPFRPDPLRKAEAYLCRGGDLPEGFAWYLLLGAEQDLRMVPPEASGMVLPAEFEYFGDGDIVRLSADRGSIASLFQRSARHHSFLLTERCNHYCLMCSQPPKDVDDDWIVDDIITAIPLIDPNTHEIGFTGGEPTLLGDRLVRLVNHCRAYLPRTGLHILTNGRAFSDDAYVAKFAAIRHRDLMFGIPIYSDISERHDYVVQANGAFDETIRGILNLKRRRLMVEVRVVIHKQTYERLPDLARFIARNLPFVDQVVLMGLEMIGFARANIDNLWIDPLDYQPQLVEAVRLLAANRMKVSIYNHQLCITDRSLWKYAKRSISDWKNEYMPECEGCHVRSQCAGFFSSAKFRYSSHIRAISALSDLRGFAA